ncbi:MAG: tRNA (N6-threonylcarbamoyladenosine(37)-N6)-methyltransferase TrmO [Acinetobacter sp.]
MMSNSLYVPTIGVMRSPFDEKFGIPRQPNLVEVEGYIEMSVPFNNPLAFEGLSQFSHLWLIWQFHENKNIESNGAFRAQIRPPRLGGNKKIGVFASRSMYRPAPLGLSVVKFQRIEYVADQLRIYVTGSDLLNGTPIVDIKPYIAYSDSIPYAESGYAQDEPQRKLVLWDELARQQRDECYRQGHLTTQRCNELEQILALDPRPAYQDDPERKYGMRFAGLNVKFSVKDDQVIIFNIIKC